MIFITSSLGFSKKINNIRISKEINNDNQIVTNLIRNLKKQEKIIYIASSPNSFEKNDLIAKLLWEGLKKSGIIFEKYYILDNRTKDNVETFFANADLIFLTGGNPIEQMQFFNDIKLKEHLKKCKGIIIGQSAGSINMAKNVFNAPEGYSVINEPKYYEGLGLIDINIEPHFILDEKDFTKDEKLLRNEVLKESWNRNIYALSDDSYILFNGTDYTLFGETFLIKNGQINQICKKKEKLKIERKR